MLLQIKLKQKNFENKNHLISSVEYPDHKTISVQAGDRYKIEAEELKSGI
jgi:hypothetical protein